MDGQALLAIGLTLVATLSGVILGWTGRAREAKKDIKKDAEADTQMRADMDYVKRGVDDIRLDLRAQGDKLSAFSERLTRCEESSKQAHKRIDRLEGAEH